ncbi:MULTISPECIES: sulfatase-like hydrolase/transferase [Microcystis]|uniref:Sulfatase-like hydrolase/transferase n=1 Tax=Microcystis viridis FACHB-1342 TaxID=2692900 RepID=A0ABR8GB10_MICVR|nr:MULTISPECIES: sulfatase-like hydrolase/transferase [Microcystis]MBD2600506.1 sulfatase-like hydrolase/transferase [Microcystis viridis FACHB-1342]MDB9389334.1 sulfatase-like hydrolase/transferase [Microcystis aeruginosa CS-583]ODV39411.1 Choline-sulfatase [Microcystis aeruginosa NIES-98]
MSAQQSVVSNVLFFDGKGDYVEIPNYPNPTESMTISVWAKSNTPTWNQTGCLVSKRDAFVLYPVAGGKSIRFCIPSQGWQETAVDPKIDITQWHHYAGTFDGKSIRLYIDGEEVARKDYVGKIQADNGSLFIGWDDGIGGRYFNGQITEVCLWNIARREQDIKGDMYRRLKGNEPGLVGYWPLNEGSGNIVTDKTGKGSNGTINGATWQQEQLPLTAKASKPNIVVFLTDQDSAAVAERWPQSFEDEHLPALKRLKKNGLTFNKMFTVTVACSPSRATLLTSTYPNQHGVINTIAEPFSDIINRYEDSYGQSLEQKLLSPTQVNLARVLKAAGYKVYWKGKWHLSVPKSDTDKWSSEDIEYMKQSYGFDGWTPLDAGVARNDLTKFGKGIFYNDERYLRGVEGVKKVIEQDAKEGRGAFSGLSPEKKEEKKQKILDRIDKAIPREEQGVLEFIENYKSEDGPFCLVVSLVNPHDIHVAPTFEKDAGYSLEDFKDFNLPIPETVFEDLSFKPSVQEIFKQGCQVKEDQRLKRIKEARRLELSDEKVWYEDLPELKDGQFATNSQQVQQMFVNFYGYLKKLADNQINEVLNALEAKGLIDDTLIVRTSDHGEMCLAHDRQREKPFNAYEEVLRVPLIISNPNLFPNAVSTDSFATTLDIVPTLAKFAGVYDLFQFAFQGCDLTPLFTNPHQEVRDAIHFTFDDGTLPPRFFKTIPRRIRTIRTKEWKYSVYFNDEGTNYEYEMYDLVNDPLEKTNVAGKPEYLEKFRQLHAQLITQMVKLKTVPGRFSIYTEEMKQQNFIPPLYWPTEDEAEYEAIMDYAANQAQSSYRHRDHKEVIKAQAKDVDPDMWWLGI